MTSSVILRTERLFEVLVIDRTLIGRAVIVTGHDNHHIITRALVWRSVIIIYPVVITMVVGVIIRAMPAIGAPRSAIITTALVVAATVITAATTAIAAAVMS
jgi:hypothetical protein